MNTVRTAVLVPLLLAILGLTVLGAGPAHAATYSGFLLGDCAPALGKAYRVQLKIPVRESRVATAFMTMNVEWCSDGLNLTYGPVIVSSNADRTGPGVLSNLARTAYGSRYSPPTVRGGPATIGTSAAWDRRIEARLGFGRSAIELDPANFLSIMIVVVYPRNATVTCTGSGPVGPEPCLLNW